MGPEREKGKRADIQFAISTTCTHARMDYIPEHFVCHVVSGEMRVIESNRQTIYRAGDSFLLRRNALAKCEQRPIGPGSEFKVIFLVLKKDFLQDYAIRHELLYIAQKTSIQPQVLLLAPTPALAGLFQSLLPYLETHTYPSIEITTLKLEEILICLQEQNTGLTNSLFTVAATSKLDLGEFMERNYMFNVPLAKFAELSGRSLSTFQREFIKIFKTQAGSWLLKRRLQAAHDLLSNSKRKPSEVYLEAVFEDLAHFSRSFKKYFGYNPSVIGKTTK
ncbi:AraC-like DNA-binding protein [Pedobacter cryoconitis]|uniref:helix-turn-helix domain-containing protein n=1 Tax=Pedobacter cryoconitis TaxID=188932 RepID=UPI0016110848|nr:helix-turn-helix domain-containing protein [Pedobacter cryoconitis]MBB6273888.1 AraC-like DNA-binding protein [Pedobacter cryoconitis]